MSVRDMMEGVAPFDLAKFTDEKFEWSLSTFGREVTTEGVVNHIRKELVEILDDPSDLEEWVDVIFLALDGASRAGYSGADVVGAVLKKYDKNIRRRWEKTRDGHFEHDRTGEARPPPDVCEHMPITDVLAGKKYCFRCGKELPT